MLKKRYLVLLLQTVFGILFITSGLLKLTAVDNFAEAIEKFKIIGPLLIEITKYIVPLIEIILGIFIIFNFNSSLPTFISALLLSLFTALITVKIFEGEEISCGCFGALSRDKLDLISIIRNLFLIIIAFIITIYYENKKNMEQEKFRKSNLISIVKADSSLIKVFLVVNILFFLSMQNLIFAMQNYGLKSRLALLVSDHDILNAEDYVDPFTINSLVDKSEHIIAFDTGHKRNVLIFLLKPTCKPCKLNLQNWQKLFQSIDQNTTRVLPISLDEYENTRKYVKNNSIKFPVYYSAESELLIKLKAFLTPQTILLSNDGKVKYVWKGILATDTVNKIIEISY